VNRRFLVTGGAGFIGSHLVERLLQDGREVVVLDNFDAFYDSAIKRRNLQIAGEHRSFHLKEGDIRDRSAVETLFATHKFDTVIHLAARAGVRPSIEDPELYTSVNLEGTTCLLEACRRHKVERFIFGSSSSVYGNNRKTPFAEDDPVDHPISPYAATKKAGEVLCHAHHHLFGMKIACLRFFTVYGPRQRPEMAIHKFTGQIAAGEKLQQFGDGSSARDYTYVDDIVGGIVAAMERVESYHVWNLGGSDTVTLSRLIEMIGKRLNREPQIEITALQPGDVDITWADTSRASQELDWRAEVKIEDGLSRFAAWYSKTKLNQEEQAL
jgi:UDP-glucuronate 4-epimerase